MAEFLIRHRRFLLLVPGLLGTPAAHAAFRDTGGGARAAAMAGAYTAVADDADAASWNAAGPSQLNAEEYGFTHTELFAGLDGARSGVNQLSAVHPLRHGGALGFALYDFSASGLYREDSLAVSYSRSLNPWLPAAWDLNPRTPALFGGVNAKYLRNGFTLDAASSGDPVFSGGRTRDALSADLGLLARWDRVSAGLSLKDVNGPDLGFQAADRVPMETRLGAAYRSPLLFLEDALISADLWSRDGRTGYALGWENWLLEKRAAFRLGYSDSALAFGFGWHMALPPAWDLRLDYAYQIPIQLKDTGSGAHRVSLVVRFDPKNKKKKSQSSARLPGRPL